MGKLDYAGTYSITKWNSYEVVAVNPLPSETFFWHCDRTTITIKRQSKEVVWVQEPINQAKAECAKSDPVIHKWTIEDSPGWEAAWQQMKFAAEVAVRETLGRKC